MQALKQIPKQDFEIDLIDDNRQTLIEQERVREKECLPLASHPMITVVVGQSKKIGDHWFEYYPDQE